MSKVRKAVITAAGRGTRQFPASAIVQKELFPIVDRDGLTKPVIQVIAEEAIESGIEEICIVTAPGQAAAYRDYFREPPDELTRSLRNKDWAMLEARKLRELGERLRFAEQASPEGFGHAVYQARSFAGNDPFLLLLGDHVYVSETCERCARQLIGVFDECEPSAVTAVQLTLERDLHAFGTIRGAAVDGERGIYRAELIVEKPDIQTARAALATPGIPAGNYLSHFGMHIFSPAIFDALEHLIRRDERDKGEIQLTGAQELLRQRSGNYLAALIRGRRYDTGVPYGLLETQLALGLQGIHRTDVLEALTRILSLPRC